MAKLWQYLQGHLEPAKSSPRLKGPKALWCAENGSKSARMAQLSQFKQGHPKPAFSEKVQRGDQGKFFKNRPKRSPCLKSPKAPWRKCHYPLISIHLKCKDWKRFWCRKLLQKCPTGPVMAIYKRSHKTRIF